MLHHVAFPFFMATTCYKPYDHLTFPVVWFSNDAFFGKKKHPVMWLLQPPGGNASSSASGIAWNTSPDVERRNVESIRCRAGRVGSGCLVVCIDACPNAPHCRLLISPEISGWNNWMNHWISLRESTKSTYGLQINSVRLIARISIIPTKIALRTLKQPIDEYTQIDLHTQIHAMYTEMCIGICNHLYTLYTNESLHPYIYPLVY